MGVGMLDREIAEFRDDILERWIEGIIEGYPEETAQFLRSQPDRFANPVGASLRDGLAEILDGVLEGTEPSALVSALDRAIRVRAVQDFEPSPDRARRHAPFRGEMPEWLKGADCKSAALRAT